MPELPEVETLRLGLQKYLVGHKILDVKVNVSKIFQGSAKDIIGAKVKEIKRVGKGLIIELDNGFDLVIHLKLTGQVIYRDKKTADLKLSDKAGGQLPNKFTHVTFALDSDAFLFYNDVRRFGWVKVIKDSKLSELPFFKEMGPEPFKDLTLEKFEDIISKSLIAIKVLLMDQKRIGGIGNIYANDALFLAGIDPRRKAKELSPDEAKKLYEAVLEVLKNGLKYGGASDVDFINVLGQEGKYQDYFLAYGKNQKKCSRCSGTIEKIMVGGRGTYFCPACQR
nr:bifunctional DNA-formamidopyrimidine glycosylase/DNA-(apurinic or apyrimidinic site) lyase [Candidatus Levybacteria bacterium]